ncbi:MarR family winged helix-turn-helix transcriptional regulator [Nocardioides speluncae]|uniref:MarR family winged helix-turn-helix transcriptional regulator n=1 Tax=Nocardioides speluncae TaxID=2670337 RepID=UPI00197FF745|nr:helix-turn-helix domain-containing protein [Nocardioides speluncae]
MGDIHDAWRAMLLAHSASVRAVEADVQRRAPIPLSWYDVLLELRPCGADGLRMQELSERVVLSRTRVSRLVDEMGSAGLVERRGDPSDGRVTWAVMTAAGGEALDQTAPIYADGIQQHFGRYLTGPQARAIATALTKVVDGNSQPIQLSRRARTRA